MKKKKNLKSYLKKYIKNIKDDEKFKYIYYDGNLTNYAVSSYGYVISLNYRNMNEPSILASETNHGYKRVVLVINNKKIHCRIHRLVAQAFIPNPKKLPIIRHKDNDKSNNNVNNLLWGTNQDNSNDAKLDGLIAFGEKHPMATINEDTVKNICNEIIKNELTPTAIATKFNTTLGIVSSILNHHTWTHITKNYDFSNYSHSCSSRLDDETVIKICRLLSSEKYDEKIISNIVKCPIYIVHDIRLRRTYKRISKHYKW